MKNRDYDFPIQLTFKISTLSNDFTAKDKHGVTLAYVKQKMFKLKEDIQVYADENKSSLLYRIRANKWIDFSAAYEITDEQAHSPIGRIARKGWASIWKAKYEIFNEADNHVYTIREENAWAKVMDSLLGEIPLLGFLTGYLFNPKYAISSLDGKVIYRMSKVPSFWGRKFDLDRLINDSEDDETLIMLSTMMMVLLERRRG